MKTKSKTAIAIASLVIASAIPFDTANAVQNETIAGRSLPVIIGFTRAYPDGSYYSTTGKECECHSWCSYNSDCTCMKHDNTSQCAAFARYCCLCYNDHEVEFYEYQYKGESVQLNEKNLYSYLKAIGNQAYVRGYTSGGAKHSVFIVGFSSKDVTVYQANYGGRCLVKQETVPYKTFLKYMKKISWCYPKGDDATYIPGPDLEAIVNET